MQSKTSSSFNFSFSSNVESVLLDVLKQYNIAIQSQSGKEITIYCPFHQNTNSPAFYINVKTGLWQCFNPSCGKTGNFRQLYKHLTGKSFGGEFAIDPKALQRAIESGFEKNEDGKSLDIESIRIDYDSELHLLQSLLDRGFKPAVLQHFEIGFSKVKDRVVIPVRDGSYNIVAFIGRAVHDYQEPRYLYSKGFKRADVLFNLNNAKRYDSVIVCEGSLDAIKVHQAGYPNVVATLGAKVSANQFTLLRRFFDSIIIFSDRDPAGEQMRDDILSNCQGKDVKIMSIPQTLKDPGEMSEDQIHQSFQDKHTTIGA